MIFNEQTMSIKIGGIIRAVWIERFTYGSERGLGWNSPCLLDCV